MKIDCLPLGLTMFMLTLFTAAAQAQDLRAQELEQKLKERDKIIIELLERVEALERRVGVQRAPTNSTDAPQQDVAPTTEGDFAEGTGLPPGAVVVEEGAAERALDRSLTRAGVLLLRSGFLELEPGFIYARQENRAPSIVNSGGQTFAGETELNANSLTAGLALAPWVTPGLTGGNRASVPLA